MKCLGCTFRDALPGQWICLPCLAAHSCVMKKIEEKKEMEKMAREIEEGLKQ